MALSNMKVFNDFVLGMTTETIQQQIELFNSASNNAIQLTSASNVGDFSHETFWQNIVGLQRRRNAYGSGNVASVTLNQEQMTSVKVAGGTPPILFEPQQFYWIQQNPERAGVIIGEQLGNAMVADQLNTAITALVTCVGQTAAVVTDASSAKIERGTLNTGASKFGDRAARLNVWVMHSKPMHDLFDENIANASRLFSIDDVSVIEDGFGRRMIMTDSPALTYDDTGTKYNVLGLTQGAVTIEDNGDFFQNIETKNGKENIERTLQTEYTFNVKVKGYSWTSNDKSPNDAALGAEANWDKVYSDVKDTAGVLVKVQ